MPHWASRSINFRLPHPGLCIKEGQLHASTPIRGGEIRYMQPLGDDLNEAGGRDHADLHRVRPDVGKDAVDLLAEKCRSYFRESDSTPVVFWRSVP